MIDLILGGLSYLIAAPIVKRMGDDRAPAKHEPSARPAGLVVDDEIPSDCSRISGFRQMFTMQDGSIFSPMVNPPSLIMEWQTAGQWFYGMVDTGASVTALTRADAERMGINVNRLRFDDRASTAGGIVRTSRVTIPDMTVGPLSIRNVDAMVGMNDFHRCTLIGQTFTLKVPRGVKVIEEGLLLYP